MTVLTVAQLGDLYGNSAEARARDGVRLNVCGVETVRGGVITHTRVNGLDFAEARVSVWQRVDGQLLRVMVVEHCGRAGLWVRGVRDAWPVTKDTLMEVKNGSAPR